MKGWAPLVFEDIQAYPSQSVYVGMVDLRQETHFRWGHGVIFGKEELELECPSCGARGSASCTAKPCFASYLFSAPTFIGGLLRSQDDHIKIPQILFRRRCAYSRSYSSSSRCVSFLETVARTVCCVLVVAVTEFGRHLAHHPVRRCLASSLRLHGTHLVHSTVAASPAVAHVLIRSAPRLVTWTCFPSFSPPTLAGLGLARWDVSSASPFRLFLAYLDDASGQVRRLISHLCVCQHVRTLASRSRTRCGLRPRVAPGSEYSEGRTSILSGW